MSTHAKTTRWPAFALAGVTLAWTATMLASLRWHFLDPFVSGILNHEIAPDFFQVPCGFKNLVAGNNIFLTEISDYFTARSAYHTHPLLAVVVGPWTAPFSPWTAYALFVGASVLFLAFAAWLLASAFETTTAKAFAYFALLFSMPTYLMLWSGQMHVFPVVAVAMILAGLMRLSQCPENAERYTRWIQIGILISLFSKPVALLMLPVLFLLPETRRKLFSPVAIYTVVSLLFLLVPRLNPGGYNAKHWLNLFHASTSPIQVIFLAAPKEFDFSDSYAIYSLPRLLLTHCSGPVLSLIVAIPVVVILAMSLSPLLLSERIHRIRMAIVMIALCILSHYLCFFLAFEYQYTTLLPLLPVLVWLRGEEQNRRLRWLLTVVLLAAACVLLPTANIFDSKNPMAYWLSSALIRVVPVLVAFVLLTIYGVASLRLHASGTLREVGKRIFAEIQSAIYPGVALGVLFAMVAAAVLVTSPLRLFISPSKWTQADLNEQFEDILSRPGVCGGAQFFFHRALAIAYAGTDEMVALQHYSEAKRLTSRHNALTAKLTVEMADVLQSYRKNDSAAKLLATLSPDEIKEPNVRKRFDELRRHLRTNGSQ